MYDTEYGNKFFTTTIFSLNESVWWIIFFLWNNKAEKRAVKWNEWSLWPWLRVTQWIKERVRERDAHIILFQMKKNAVKETSDFDVTLLHALMWISVISLLQYYYITFIFQKVINTFLSNTFNGNVIIMPIQNNVLGPMFPLLFLTFENRQPNAGFHQRKSALK